MNYFKLNIEAIKKRNKKLYDRVICFMDNKKVDLSDFEIIDTKNGEKTVKIKKHGKEIRLNSLYNPQKEAEQWVKRLDFSNLDIPVVMFGIGNGVLSKKILENLSENSVVVLVEPDILLFIFCLTYFDMRRIIEDERVIIVVDKLNSEILDISLRHIITLKTLNTQVVCYHPNMEKIYFDEIEEFNKSIVKCINKCQINYNTQVVLGFDTMENTIKNLHFIKDSNYVLELVNLIPKDIPFIIVAAGPSLDKNINELKKAEGKAFILVVDRAVNNVIKHGIKFDAIISVDAGKSIEYMSDVGSFIYPIFACQDSKNELLELNKGRKIWLNSTVFLDKIYRKYGVKTKYYQAGGSVATAAFNVARMIESRTIVLVGQDLAFQGELTHAGGEKEKHPINAQVTYVDGIDGEKVKTRRDWLTFLEWYKDAINQLEDNITVIDATEGGAKIEGTKIMKLSDVIEKYCKKEFDFKKVLQKLCPTFESKKYQEVRQDILHLEQEILSIKECAEKGKKTVEEWKRMIDDNIIEKNKEVQYSETIKEMNEIIEEQLVYSIIDEFIKPAVEHIMMGVNCIGEDDNENNKETCKISEIMYEKILEGIDIIEPLLKKELEKV